MGCRPYVLSLTPSSIWDATSCQGLNDPFYPLSDLRCTELRGLIQPLEANFKTRTLSLVLGCRADSHCQPRGQL